MISIRQQSSAAISEIELVDAEQPWLPQCATFHGK